MGAVEDTCKVAQDFLAPELREIHARIQALEETTQARLDAQDETTKARFDLVAERAKAYFQTLGTRLRSREESTKAHCDAQDCTAAANHAAVMHAISSLTNYAALAERLPRLETERGRQAYSMRTYNR